MAIGAMSALKGGLCAATSKGGGPPHLRELRLLLLKVHGEQLEFFLEDRVLP